MLFYQGVTQDNFHPPILKVLCWPLGHRGVVNSCCSDGCPISNSGKTAKTEARDGMVILYMVIYIIIYGYILLYIYMVINIYGYIWLYNVIYINMSRLWVVRNPTWYNMTTYNPCSRLIGRLACWSERGIPSKLDPQNAESKRSFFSVLGIFLISGSLLLRFSASLLFQILCFSAFCFSLLLCLPAFQPLCFSIFFPHILQIILEKHHINKP